MDFLKYFEREKAQKHIDRIARKYKNKKVILYGAGQYARALIRNYDISKINAIGIADRRFERPSTESFFGLKTFAPSELKKLDIDVIVLTVLEYDTLRNILKDLLYSTKNEKIKITPMIKKSLWRKIIEMIEE